MEKREVVRYLYFGTCMRFLQDAREGMFVRGPGNILVNIEAFIDSLTELQFTVTTRTDAFQNLLNLWFELMGDTQEDEEPDPDQLLTRSEAERLQKTMNEIRLTLMAEARGNVAFVTTEKRLDIKKLLDDVGALVTPESFSKLPEIAKEDLREAGKCIAFERPTAAAFHLLRGTESVLREFYKQQVKRNRIKPPFLWDGMVRSLEARRQPPPAPLLENLTNIRRSFRNPTQHPEKSYDIEEVQDLFGLCVDVIRRMAAHLPEPPPPEVPF